MDISVIIVNYNTLHVIKPCIESIVTLTHDVSYEIIVVDNGSTDGSAEQLSSDPRIRFIATGENLGFGKANNIGIKHAKGDLLFFLNSDTLLVNNALKMLSDFATQFNGRLGALGCVLEDTKGNAIHSYGPFPTMSYDWKKLVWIPIKKALHIYKEAETVYPDTWLRVDYVTGADMLVSRHVLEECGTFHPAFFMYFEESELQHRFHQHGYDNVIVRGPRIIHLEGEGSNDGKTSKFLRDTYRQQKSEYIYFRLTEPYWKYVMYRIVHPILRQTVWLNPHVSLADKWTFVKQLFVRIKL